MKIQVNGTIVTATRVTAIRAPKPLSVLRAANRYNMHVETLTVGSAR